MIEYSNKNISSWTRLGMRKAFGPMLTEVAKEHDNLIALTADVADSANLLGFRELYPGRFYNIGIAEQNMTGIAAGLAKEGNNVFISSFAPFVSMRNYEAIRTLIGYMHLNVKVVALASGMSLGVQGSTHFCLEDISLLRSIPEMLILSPADVVEEAECIEFLASYDGPVYLRLTGIDGSPCIHKDKDSFDINEPHPLREGEDIVIFSTGSITSECVRASRALKKDGLSCSVYDVCALKPINEIMVREVIDKHRYIVTVEEHFTIGGLGDIIGNISLASGFPKKIIKIGVADTFPHAGDYSYLLSEYGLTASYIREKVLANIGK